MKDTKPKRRAVAMTGDDIDTAIERESQRKEEQAAARANGTDRVFRFYLNQGDETEIIFLDKDISNGVAFYEHHLQDSQGKWTVHEVCPGEVASCAICNEVQGNNPAFVLNLSVLHLNAFQDKKTKEWRNSRELFCIKHQQLPKFKKILKAAVAKYGTLRGVVLRLHRPKGEATSSPRIGEPVPFDSGMSFEFVKNLKKEYGHPAIRSQQTKAIVKEEDVDITAFDYEAIFPHAFDVDALVDYLDEKYGSGKGAPGSRKDVGKDWEEDPEDDAPTTQRQSPRKRVPVDEDDDVDVTPTARSSTKPSRKQAPVEGPSAKEEEEGSDEDASLGALADAGGEEAAIALQERADALEVDTNDFATWVDVEEHLNTLESEKSGEEEEEDSSEEEAVDYAELGTLADGGDQDSVDLLFDYCEQAGIDSDAYGTWGEVAVALASQE